MISSFPTVPNHFFKKNTSFNVLSNSDNFLKIYPNPVKNMGTLEFSIERTSNVSYEIYDVLGKKVSNLNTFRVNSGNHVIDLNTELLEHGTYFIKYQIGDQVKAAQFIVSH